jgi:hypothetical protein
MRRIRKEAAMVIYGPTAGYGSLRNKEILEEFKLVRVDEKLRSYK